MAEENQGSFKVTDRRMFNTDGSLRDDAVIEETPAPEPVPEPAPPAVPAPAAKTFSAAEITGAVSAKPPAPPAPPPYVPPAAPPASAAFEPVYEDEQGLGEMPEQTEFTEFLMRIASEAFIYLGLVEHPMTGRRQVDLQAAKESIDMLLMLRAKTEGNLTPGETRFYDDLLADLKMQFVSFRR
mgnify:CR=1 FL=1